MRTLGLDVLTLHTHVHLLYQFLVDAHLGSGNLDVGTVMGENNDLVTSWQFVGTNHSLGVEIRNFKILC